MERRIVDFYNYNYYNYNYYCFLNFVIFFRVKMINLKFRRREAIIWFLRMRCTTLKRDGINYNVSK